MDVVSMNGTSIHSDHYYGEALVAGGTIFLRVILLASAVSSTGYLFESWRISVRQKSMFPPNTPKRKPSLNPPPPFPLCAYPPPGGHQHRQYPPSSSSAAGHVPFNTSLGIGGGGNSVAPSPASSTGRAPSVASSPVESGGTLPGSGGGRPLKDVIVMAPCGAREVLPSNPDLPADLFTSCLTTPMRMALRWFVRQNKVTVRPCVRTCVRTFVFRLLFVVFVLVDDFFQVLTPLMLSVLLAFSPSGSFAQGFRLSFPLCLLSHHVTIHDATFALLAMGWR